MEKDDKQSEEDLSIDFSEIGKKIKSFFNKTNPIEKESSPSHPQEEPEELSLDFNKAKDFAKKNIKWIIPVVCILIAMVFSIYFRTMPMRMPITDNWAESTVQNYYLNQIQGKIDQQYPNLPDQNKQTLVNQEWQKFSTENKDLIAQQIQGTSEQFRSHYTYIEENKEYPWLPDIDSYLFYGYGKNYLKCGHAGCVEKDEEFYTYRNGRDGLVSGMTSWVYMGVYIYKIMNFFFSTPLMQAFFLLPLFAITLAVIPAFFIGRKLGGNMGGFIAALFIAMNQAILSRSIGTSDQDAGNVLFPLLILWFFVEALYSKKWKNTVIFSILGGISFYVYSGVWHTEQIFYFLFGAVIIFAIISIIKEKWISHHNLKTIWTKLKEPLLNSGIFLGISLVSLMIYSPNFIYNSLKSIIGFVIMKQVAVDSVWPNVLTTVAEFNTVPLQNIISQMGGTIFFIIAVLGLLLTFLRKENHNIIIGIALVLWLGATTYSFTKGVRFALLMAPAFAVALGAGIGILYYYLCKWISSGMRLNETVVKIVLVGIVSLLFISPIVAANNIAVSSIPLYNDEWENTLTSVQKDAADGIGYITTWWDYGHFFVAHDIRVTFDGGNQQDLIYWVGKSLLTNNEKSAVGILQMLNCGQGKAPHVLENYIQNDTVKSVDLINKIILENKEGAKKLLKANGLSESAIEEILNLTHCDNLLPQYFITSEDMVGKSGVWGHFGSWDFYKAEMWQRVRGSNRSEGLAILQEPRYNLTTQQADQIYMEIQTTDADRWVAPWPGYSGRVPCNKKGEVLNCQIQSGQGTAQLNIDLRNFTATIPAKDVAHPNSLVYATKEGIQEKEFKGNLIGVSAILLPDNTVILADPLQAKSMFTQLFFFEGHGLKCFQLLDNQRQINGEKIYLWKVDWACQNANNVYFQPQIKAEHILIGLNDRTTEEALALAKEIKTKISASNFEDLARKYSEDPSSAAQGGDLGWFGKGTMVPEFESAAFSLRIGEVSAPIKTQFGYHLIKVVDKK